MNVDALLHPFGLPAGGAAEAFALAQVALHRQAPALGDYRLALQRHVAFAGRRRRSPPPLPGRSRAGRLLRGAAEVVEELPFGTIPRSLRVDVLLCGVWAWERTAETRLWLEVIDALLATGRSVAVLVHRGTALGHHLGRERRAEIASGQLRAIDPRGLLVRAGERLGATPAAPARARRDFETVRDLLAAEGIHLSGRALDLFGWIAARREEWRRRADRLEFGAALVRCHWLPLASAVVRTSLERGVPTASLQQGVVAHSMDVPLAVHRLAVFGPAAAAVLGPLDDAFSALTGRRPTCRALPVAGPFLDRPRPLPAPTTRARHTVLVLDQAQPWALDYHGLHGAQEELEGGLGRLLRTRPRARVRVRPHPAGGRARAWEGLRANWPRRVELSHPGADLDDDLRQSAAAVTLFSGAGASAAAAGRPVFFHAPPGGFHPPELEPFAPFRTGDPRELAERLGDVLDSTADHERESDRARTAARAYFGEPEGGRTESLVSRLLAPL